VAPVAELIAHGGLAGAILEALIVLAVIGVFAAAWLRERVAAEDAREPEPLSEDDSTTS
jgi:hypothetical protein